MPSARRSDVSARSTARVLRAAAPPAAAPPRILKKRRRLIPYPTSTVGQPTGVIRTLIRGGSGSRPSGSACDDQPSLSCFKIECEATRILELPDFGEGSNGSARPPRSSARTPRRSLTVWPCRWTVAGSHDDARQGGESSVQNAPNSFPSAMTTVSAINGPTSPTIMISR